MEKTRHPGIYRRGDRYVAVVSYREGSGASKQKWITRRGLKAALDARRKFLDELDRGVKPGGGKMTLGTFLTAEWLPEVAATRRPLTLEKYRRTVAKHIIPALGGVRLRDLGRDDLRGFYRGLATPTLAHYCHSVLSSAISYAVKDRGLLSANPCAAIRPPRAPHHEAAYLDLDEARRMLDSARGDRLEGAIILGLVGGLRRGEACAVRWADLDLDTGSLIVRGSYWGQTKSGRVRGLTLPASAVRSLRRYKAEQAQGLLALGIRQDDDTHVLTTFDGGQMVPHTLGKTFRAFCEEHGFEGVTFHALRHSHASILLAGGADVKTVASRLGHANPALLFSTYAHVIQSADQAAAERLEAVLG